MQLDPETLRQLARLTLETKPAGISCDDWIHRVGEYVEARRRGDPLDERLRIVEQHGEQCAGCAEELATLLELFDEPS